MARSLQINSASERLAKLLNASPYAGQTEDLKRFLDNYSSFHQSVERLVNYPNPPYHGRTAVHLAANNGLFDCLEELLKRGGQLKLCVL